ncbi:VOC family protein [Prosthecomicrobium sp. N25]|uniref:VOC family protein n=1 Tax=Prosthecomicrobium sp. N25 TaxID=3129254 RepID=UPI0030788AD0
MGIRPYIFFDGRCEEALDFYRTALGAEVTALMRYADNPDRSQPSMVPPGSEQKVMHAQLSVGGGEIFCSDGLCHGQPRFQGISVTLDVPTAAEADRAFAALAEGGTVQMPMAATFFSPRFGMVADRFGLGWMIIANGA